MCVGLVGKLFICFDDTLSNEFIPGPSCSRSGQLCLAHNSLSGG